jgi:hypothetical protein
MLLFYLAYYAPCRLRVDLYLILTGLIHTFLKRKHDYAYCQYSYVFYAISCNCDSTVFTNTLKSYHHLHQLSPANKCGFMQLHHCS